MWTEARSVGEISLRTLRPKMLPTNPVCTRDTLNLVFAASSGAAWNGVLTVPPMPGVPPVGR